MSNRRTEALIFVVILLTGAVSVYVLQPLRSAPLVRDQADILNAEQEERIANYHQAILTTYDIDLRVVTSDSADDIDTLAVGIFEQDRVGENSSTARGLLFLISPEIDQVRMETSRTVEPVFTDIFTSYVEERQMVPFFQADRVADGILATTELIASRAEAALRNEAFIPPAKTFEPSSGAGASTRARIGTGYERPEGPQLALQQGYQPYQVVEAYISAMEDQNANPDLAIYSRASQTMFQDWVVTPAQMRNVAKTYQDCPPAVTRSQGGFAVVQYPVEVRTCSPFFLHREEGAWRLDFPTMSQTIRFNQSNQWFVARSLPENYKFAFAGQAFDQNGFPLSRPKR
ncbi:hypothetical protein RA27_17960 [Ruegeria sp. ANG-R]|uniref:TPM domain-containing protein n=1 Tax=Ruegeria sp. ANG-R TaxID=1577903 RepID=UPI00057CFFB9|nr:TPM domain-containing protein [Ruegeria sp. ANG-R]KIC39041.1 hypothetical protein RA27_17960 [Ruegeria sp. ANG-R]